MGCKWCAGLLSPCGLGLGGGRVAALPLGRASLRPGAPGARQGGHARGRLGSTLGICGWHPCPGSRVPTRCLGPCLFQGKSRLAPSGGAPFSRSSSGSPSGTRSVSTPRRRWNSSRDWSGADPQPKSSWEGAAPPRPAPPAPCARTSAALTHSHDIKAF